LLLLPLPLLHLMLLAKKGVETESSVTLTVPTKDPIDWPLK
jgi:hypothetical protein